MKEAKSQPSFLFWFIAAAIMSAIVLVVALSHRGDVHLEINLDRKHLRFERKQSDGLLTQPASKESSTAGPESLDTAR